ncbi:hypothetical protein SKAU_G00178850 [Synaphobranchus kaupii]|uniref:Bcl-x interacting BH3 domain-containing protein n=1 Tax=Synaphobranchus kaupii TaxID=118154 RepID=A0A9Q1FLW8_SYNKA|nr:hypothetical protein SKAU_G00178850 [Synaphobranchus kaupii]
MSHPSRFWIVHYTTIFFEIGQTRVNGPTTLIERGEGGESQTSSGADSQPSRPGEGDVIRGGITMSHSLLGYQSRSPVFRTLSRSSSGYFSFDCDSVPSSPLMTYNKSTQTPSPSSQVIAHAQRRISDVHQNSQHYEMPQAAHRRFRPRSLSMPADMRAETWVAQELRRIGDELNSLYLHRGVQGVRDRNGIAGWPDVGRGQNRPALLLWISVLFRRLLQILRRR